MYLMNSNSNYAVLRDCNSNSKSNSISNSNSNSNSNNHEIRMFKIPRSTAWFFFLLLAWTSRTVVELVTVVNGLSSISQSQSQSAPPVKRPIVSLTGEGDVSGFIYGKIQRATSIYGSGLIAPATAIVHGDKDRNELLPQNSYVATQTPKRQLKDLENMLWNQFGMATCEGSVEREDLLTPMSYLKPRLCELQYTLLFLDVTTTTIKPKNKSNNKNEKAGGGGLGGLFSSILSKKEPQQQQQQQQQQPSPDETDTNDFFLDVDLVRSAVTRGSNVFVVCESKDTEACTKALANCIASLGSDEEGDKSNNSFVTLIAPDENVLLGVDDDARWNSLRPQDLEGELSQAISVRDGTHDCFKEKEEDVSPAAPLKPESGFKRTREERLAAAYSEDLVPLHPPQPVSFSSGGGDEKKVSDTPSSSRPKYSKLSRHDLAEVCVQCALRLPTNSSDESNNQRIRVVRVTPTSLQEEGTERSNQDYFSMTGGPKAKARAGTVTSVDWVQTLSCFADATTSGDPFSVKAFPKRPDVK